MIILIVLILILFAALLHTLSRGKVQDIRENECQSVKSMCLLGWWWCHLFDQKWNEWVFLKRFRKIKNYGKSMVLHSSLPLSHYLMHFPQPDNQIRCFLYFKIHDKAIQFNFFCIVSQCTLFQADFFLFNFQKKSIFRV